MLSKEGARVLSSESCAVASVEENPQPVLDVTGPRWESLQPGNPFARRSVFVSVRASLEDPGSLRTGVSGTQSAVFSL